MTIYKIYIPYITINLSQESNKFAMSCNTIALNRIKDTLKIKIYLYSRPTRLAISKKKMVSDKNLSHH